MAPELRIAALACAVLLSACTAAGGATSAGMAAAGTGAPTALRTFWPEGVPTPPPMRAAPQVGPSENGSDLLGIDYEPPHLHFSLKSAPAGTYSVIFLVASTRFKRDRMQIDSVDPDASFKAMLEYDRLEPGEYSVRAFVKGNPEPVDTRTIQVPDSP